MEEVEGCVAVAVVASCGIGVAPEAGVEPNPPPENKPPPAVGVAIVVDVVPSAGLTEPNNPCELGAGVPFIGCVD
jgi:hypothetical protein